MENVTPFRAWRYAPSAGELTQLVAPPYDVINAGLQSSLYARNHNNVVRVDLGLTTPCDTDHDNRYTRAAVQLGAWKTNGTLVQDARPTITFVEEDFIGPDGRARTRHGFLALMRLHEFCEGVVFPHEYTLSGPKEDRFQLLTATAMCLSPVFLLYDLPGDQITHTWETGPGLQAPSAAITDEEGAITRLWPTSDPTVLKCVKENLAASRFIIADGHHRYETALRYRSMRRLEVEAQLDKKIDAQGAADGTRGRENAPSYDYVLAYFGNMSDPGLAIYATHRLISGLDPETVRKLPQLLTSTFEVKRLGDGETTDPASVQALISSFLESHPRGAFGLWGSGLDAAYGFRLADREAVRAAAQGYSRAYQELDVTILQTLVLERLLGITAEDIAAERHVAFFKDPSETFDRLASGEYQAGFFMNPTGLDQIREVAFGGERMPQKATYFYPKLPTGLVFQDLNGMVER